MNYYMNFSSKEIVSVFSWNNSKYSENTAKEVRINGRLHYAIGKLQNVTFNGIVNCVETTSNKPYKYLLTVGMATQHPIDYKMDKELANEVATENAFINPIITMEVCKDFNQENFVNIIKEYYLTNIHNNLSLIKTPKEIKNGLKYD